MVEEPLQYPLAYPAYLCQPDGGRTGAGGHTDPDNLSGSADQQHRGKRLRTGGPDRGQYEIPRGGQWISFAEEPGKVYMMRAIFGTSGLRDEGVVIAEIDKAIFEDRFRPLEEKRQFGILSVEKRIRILYGEQYGISLSSGVGEGTVVLVRLRLYHRIVQGLTRGGDERRKRNSRPVFNTGLPGKRTCLLFLFDPAAVRFIHLQTMVSRNIVPLYPAARSRLFFRDRVFQPASVQRLHLCRWRCRRGCLPFWRGLSQSAALPHR